MVDFTLNKSKEVFIYPTDTVWGIGGNIFSKDIYSAIEKIKGTKERKPLSVLFSDIEQLKNFIDIPEQFSNDWLREYYSLESTLALPKKWVKCELPEWVCYDSEYISLRCLDLKEVVDLIKQVGGPITSTSLNKTGEAPMSDQKEAKDFHQEHASSCTFVDQNESELSGHSSTIMAFDGDKFHCFRKGYNFEKIEKLLERLK